MPKDSKQDKAGLPRRFTFKGKEYFIGRYSVRQTYELNEIIKRHIPDPMVDAKAQLEAMGDILTPDERLLILREAQEQRRKKLVTRVRIFWNPDEDDPVKSIISDDANGFTVEHADALGLDLSTPIGEVCKNAWKRGLRPDKETGQSEADVALRDALNEYFNDEAKEVTEQIGGWPPALDSEEAFLCLYAGPGLPETLAVLMPRYNPGMSREDCQALGTAILDDETNEGLIALGRALAPEDDDEADKSGPRSETAEPSAEDRTAMGRTGT